MAVRIITDSAADLGEFKHDKLTVVPLHGRFGDEEFLDGVELTPHQFYEKLIETDEMPKTAQATPFQFEEAIDAAGDDDVVIITLASKLSGTNQSANIAAMDRDNVYVIDSDTASLGENILVRRALELADEGKTAKEITDILNEEKGRIRLIALLDTLEYLKKGGRISAAAAAAGNMLKLKPVINILNGEVGVIGKARGSKKGQNLLREQVAAEAVDYDMPFVLGYTGDDQAMLNKYIEDSPELLERTTPPLPIVEVGPAIGTYAGPGVIGLAYFTEK